MKEKLNQWLKEKSKASSAAAIGIFYPNKTRFTHTFSTSAVPGPNEDDWATLAEMAGFAREQNFPATNLRWIFGKACVYSAIRSDEACVIIIAPRNLPKTESAALENLLSDFQKI